MRLIECKTHIFSSEDMRDSCIDLDHVKMICKSNEGAATVCIDGTLFDTDIPYEKAVELWENYQKD